MSMNSAPEKQQHGRNRKKTSKCSRARWLQQGPGFKLFVHFRARGYPDLCEVMDVFLPHNSEPGRRNSKHYPSHSTINHQPPTINATAVKAKKFRRIPISTNPIKYATLRFHDSPLPIRSQAGSGKLSLVALN